MNDERPRSNENLGIAIDNQYSNIWNKFFMRLNNFMR